MVRTKTPSGSAVSPSRPSERGKKKKGGKGKENPSKKRRIDPSNQVFKVLFNSNVTAFQEFSERFEGKKVVKGRTFSFKELGAYQEGWDLNVASWLSSQDWISCLTYEGPTYPRLVQILVSNFSPISKKSWIGKTSIDMSPKSLRSVLGLSYIEPEEEEAWPARGKIFSDLAKTEIDSEVVALQSSYLNMDQKIAHNLIYNNIYPKVGSTHQLPEKDARVLWALEFGRKLDLAKILCDQLEAYRIKPSGPIPYGMYLSRLILKYKINVESEAAHHFRETDCINNSTLNRMGYRWTKEGWKLFKGKERKSASSSRLSKRRRIEEVREEEEGEREEEEEEERTETAAPEQPSPATPSSRPPPTPTTSLASLKSFITSSIKALETSMTTQFTQLNQRLENLETSVQFKLDTIISLVESTQPPDPHRAKMKGVVIQSRSQSSSESYHFSPHRASPIRSSPFIPTYPETQQPEPSTQPIPQPTQTPHTSPHQSQADTHISTSHHTKEPSPKPVPETTPTSPAPESPRTQPETLEEEIGDSEIPSPKPQSETPLPEQSKSSSTSSSRTISDHLEQEKPTEETSSPEIPKSPTQQQPSQEETTPILLLPWYPEPIPTVQPDQEPTQPSPQPAQPEQPSSSQPSSSIPQDLPIPPPDRRTIVLPYKEYMDMNERNENVKYMNRLRYRMGIPIEPIPYPGLEDPSIRARIRIMPSAVHVSHLESPPTPLASAPASPPPPPKSPETIIIPDSPETETQPIPEPQPDTPTPEPQPKPTKTPKTKTKTPIFKTVPRKPRTKRIPITSTSRPSPQPSKTPRESSPPPPQSPIQYSPPTHTSPPRPYSPPPPSTSFTLQRQPITYTRQPKTKTTPPSPPPQSPAPPASPSKSSSPDIPSYTPEGPSH